MVPLEPIRLICGEFGGQLNVSDTLSFYKTCVSSFYRAHFFLAEGNSFGRKWRVRGRGEDDDDWSAK